MFDSVCCEGGHVAVGVRNREQFACVTVTVIQIVFGDQVVEGWIDSLNQWTENSTTSDSGFINGQSVVDTRVRFEVGAVGGPKKLTDDSSSR